MKRSRGSSRRPKKSQSSYGQGKAKTPGRSSVWEQQIQRELELRRRRARQAAFDFQLRAEDVSTARAKLGAARKKKRPTAYAGAMGMQGGPRQYRTKTGKFTPAHPGYREFGMVEKNPCERRKERRAVLLAKGKVTRPGGAPGPYKPRSKISWDC